MKEKKMPSSIKLSHEAAAAVLLDSNVASVFEPFEPKEEAVKTLIGRDEMNLAEFPFAVLSEKVEQGMQSLRFTDSIVGKEGKVVARTWSVTGSQKYGLPRGKDIEVLQALMKVSLDANFKQKINQFTMYGLLKIMGWSDNGWSYKRVEEALDRLVGVTIKAENAFWDNEKKNYLSVGFNILDNYQLWKANEKRGRQPKRQQRQPLSSFTWGDIMFQSFQKGYLKPIDLGIFYGLQYYVSKRLYQYLDKKSYKRSKFEKDIYILAFEKLGLSRRYYLSQIKRILDRAHKELLAVGFLRSAEYIATADGSSCKIVYHFVPRNQRLKRKSLPRPIPVEDLAGALMQEGMDAETARQLVAAFPAALIHKQLEALSWREITKSRTGVLLKSIKEDWSLPLQLDYRQRQQAQQQRAAATEAGQAGEQESFEVYERFIKEGLEQYRAVIGPAQAAHIVEEESRQILAHLGKKNIAGDPVLEDMLLSFVNRRLKEEARLPTFDEWRAQHDVGSE